MRKRYYIAVLVVANIAADGDYNGLKDEQRIDLERLINERTGPGPYRNYEDLPTAIFANVGLFDKNYFHRCKAFCLATEQNPERIEVEIYPTQYGTFSIVVPSRKNVIFTRQNFALWCEGVLQGEVRKDRRSLMEMVGNVETPVRTMYVVASEDSSDANVDGCEYYQLYAPWNKDQARSGPPRSKSVFVSKFVKCSACSPEYQKIYAAEPEWLHGDIWLRCEEIKASRGSTDCLSRRVEAFNPYPDKLDDDKRIFYTILDFVRSRPTSPELWGFHPPLYDPLDRKGLTELRFATYSDVEMERCHWLPVQNVPWTTMPHHCTFDDSEITEGV
ncbi:hypothetical protein AAVH_26345 [Aphelenchoides avenae]|nr:hypothetical protein AAVH_26345 [Aphelenchus avenae]